MASFLSRLETQHGLRGNQNESGHVTGKQITEHQRHNAILGNFNQEIGRCLYSELKVACGSFHLEDLRGIAFDRRGNHCRDRERAFINALLSALRQLQSEKLPIKAITQVFSPRCLNADASIKVAELRKLLRGYKKESNRSQVQYR